MKRSRHQRTELDKRLAELKAAGRAFRRATRNGKLLSAAEASAPTGFGGYFHGFLVGCLCAYVSTKQMKSSIARASTLTAELCARLSEYRGAKE